MNTKQYQGIDILKFILANLIIVLHCAPLSAYTYYGNLLLSNGIARMAVPLFFCISGYFFFSKIDRETLPEKMLWKYEKRNFGLYVVWTIIYLPLIIQDFMTEKYTNTSFVMKLAIFVRRFLFIGSWTPLWFFIGTCVAVALVYILLKLKFSPNAILAISLIIYLSIGCLSNAYSMFGEMLISKYHWVSILTRAYLLIFGDTKNGFVFGFFFVAMGMKLAFSTEKEVSLKRNLIFLMASIGLLLAEVALMSKFNPRDYNMMISLVPCTYFAFQFFLNLRMKERILYKYLRQLSILMYGMQGLFMQIQAGNSLQYYLFVLVASLMSGCIILYLQKYIKFLRILY